MAQEVHKGDVGTIFRLIYNEDGAAVDLSTATTKQIIFMRPDGQVRVYTAAFQTDGTDGSVQYTTTSKADIDQVGQWMYQAFVVLSTGEWYSQKKPFKVYSVLN